MAIEELPPFTIQCPSCHRKLKVADKVQGKRTTCPACKAPIDIPVRSGGDRNLVASPQAKVPSVSTSSLDQELDDFGFELAKVQEKSDRKEAEVLDASSNLDLNTPREEEFRYPCKVCGTAMYARKKDIGSMARCPDCYSEFSVPSPPKSTKPKTPGPKLESYADLPLVPPEDAKEKSREAGRSSAAEYLANAEKELDNVEDQRRSVSYDFDTSGWFKRTFAFLADPTLIILSFGVGAILGGVFILSSLMEATLAMKSEDAGSFGGMLILILAGSPFIVLTLANGIAVLESSANQHKHVERWPMFNPTDSMGEIAMVVTASVYAALPGGVMSAGIAWLEMDQAIGFGMVLLSAFLLFPIILLSMLDNQSFGQPVSGEVVHSITAKADAWAAMYLVTGLGFTGIFLGYLSARVGSMGLQFAYGLLLPIAIYFIFHQYGVLASCITDLVRSERNEDDDSSAE
jgi:hypothetical protein